jgi:hypothetical protein
MREIEAADQLAKERPRMEGTGGLQKGSNIAAASPFVATRAVTQVNQFLYMRGGA